ncbi:MAG: hypothetical protein V4736_09360 [Bdellovibrionota bacterium]
MMKPGLFDFSETNFQSLLPFALKRWKKSIAWAVGLILIALVARFAVVPYEMTSTITIHDPQNSQLQAFSNNFFALSKTQGAPTRKNNSAERATDILERHETYASFLQMLKDKANSTKPVLDREAAEKLESKLGTKLATLDPANRKLSRVINEMVSFKTLSPSEIKLTVSTPDRELAFFVGLEFLDHAVKVLKEHESKEIQKVKAALEKQRDQFKSQFMKITEDLSKFQKRPENIISLASGNSLGNYMSDLMVRKNEVELQIAENQRTIEFLGGTKAAHLAIARDLGQRSQIRQLLDETSLLKKQVASLQGSINRITSQTSGTVEAMRMYDELKKSADADFKNFQEANDTLSKLVVYQISIDSKFEPFEVPEFEDIKPAIASSTLIALAILLSQMFFSMFLYLEWVRAQKREEAMALALKSHEGAGEYTRNEPVWAQSTTSPTNLVSFSKEN